MGTLDGKVAVVTGGASGIGRACSLRFAAEGARVVIADVLPDRGEETAAEVRATGQDAIFVPVDTSREEDCDAMAAQAAAAFGKIVVGVAAAGVRYAGYVSGTAGDNPGVDGRDDILSVDVADWRRVLDINLTGVMLTDRAVARRMVDQGTGGAIVNIASVNARVPMRGSGAYCSSKAGVLMLTQVLALELSRYDIRVNAVGPGPTSTPMVEDLQADEATNRFFLRQVPMRRWGAAGEIAAAVHFLACGESSFITGEMVTPAGGWYNA